jgi:hypothetical protein
MLHHDMTAVCSCTNSKVGSQQSGRQKVQELPKSNSCRGQPVCMFDQEAKGLPLDFAG